MWICKNCGKENYSNRSTCWDCSTQFSDTEDEKVNSQTESKAFKSETIDENKVTEIKDSKSLSASSERPKFDFSPMPLPIDKPSYLTFLRLFAGLNLVVGILGAFVFLLKISQILSSSRMEDFLWLVGLAIALEGFLAYGLLNAVADIAENMIEVGEYVRELKRQKKS